jgi:hypothetical protein
VKSSVIVFASHVDSQAGKRTPFLIVPEQYVNQAAFERLAILATVPRLQPTAASIALWPSSEFVNLPIDRFPLNHGFEGNGRRKPMRRSRRPRSGPHLGHEEARPASALPARSVGSRKVAWCRVKQRPPAGHSGCGYTCACGDAVRPRLGDKECARRDRRRARPAYLSPGIDACGPHCNISCNRAAGDGGNRMGTVRSGNFISRRAFGSKI